MSPDHVIESFIKEFVQDLHNDSAAIFAGAGLSKGSGYVDWPELLSDIAKELGLNVDKEHDLISLAQFHVNTRRSSDGLAKKILQEFSEQAEPSEVHDIIARLPIHSFWTTNYDSLIEDALRKAFRVPDVKYVVDHLTISRPKRDAIVYKMHGDVQMPQQAIIYKEQYEKYYLSHAPFITALSGDLVSKTFLFLGFSFTDPNLDYVLSRLHGGSSKRNHYCFMREAQRTQDDDDELFQYRRRKQDLRIEDLKRFGIQTLLVDDYSQITGILKEIEARYRKRTVFFSGSAEEYGTWSRRDAMDFVHNVAAKCIEANCRVVNGFGWGIGSAVINGALEAIYGKPEKYSEAQLIVRPFPQQGQNLQELWEQYRQRMISLAGIALFFFGNKLDGDSLVNANGVRREFEIALEHGLLPIPVAATGFMAEELWNEILADTEKYYGNFNWVVPMVEKLVDPKTPPDEMVKTITSIVKKLNS
ncbi:MAG: SIR2 family protein [Sphingomonadaceae bacterium]